MDQTATTPPRPRALTVSPALIVLLLILAVTLALRLYGVDWDRGAGVHPDERFIGQTLVHNLTLPTSPFDLFDRNSGWDPAVAVQDPGGVPINGHVVHDPAGFNYGSLPLYIIFFFAHVMAWLGGFIPGWSSWQHATDDAIQAGRVLSALADTVTVFLVYLIGTRLAGKITGLYAAALAAFAVLSIQLSHFTTVDILLTTFATGTLLTSIDLFTHGRPRDYALVGLWLAAAIATKASAVPFVGVVVVAHLWRQGRLHDLLGVRTLQLPLYTLAAGLPALFLFQPYMFSDWSDFWTGVTGQQALATGSTIVFYTIKWHGTTPLLYPFQQLTNYSLGLPLALLAYAGLLYEAIRTLTPRRNAGALVACYVIIYFLSAGVLYMKYLRYMEPIVPALCVLAALLISAMVRTRTHTPPIRDLHATAADDGVIEPTPAGLPSMRSDTRLPATYAPDAYHAEATTVEAIAGDVYTETAGFPRAGWDGPTPAAAEPGGGPSAIAASGGPVTTAAARRRPRRMKPPARPDSGLVRVAGLALGALVLALTACYGLAYEHIYTQPVTRVQATCWMFTHIPGGTPIALDTFDEGMPVGGTCSPPLKLTPSYPTQGLPDYGSADTLATPQSIAATMANARYYIISSRRAMDTVAAEPAQYPYYHRFYQLLLGSKLGVQDPLGYTLVKTVIEHPQLGPWTDTEQGANQNFNEYDHPPVYIFKNTGHEDATTIMAALDEGGTLAPPTALATPPKSLLLTATQLARNQHAPSYGQVFPADSLPMRLPILVWWLLIEAIGLLALPFSMRLFGRLRDGGFVVAKTAGILLLAWFAWILPSLGIAEYSRGEIALCLLPLAGLSLLWGVRLPDLLPILRRRLRPILLAEGAFLLGFAFFVYLRMLYPDMWHLISGGEKTMDFSFLNAIVRSRTMPPYDPWFSGGYLNYYYYGHFTVATLLKLAGIAPVIAINLAIPTFFALALATCVSIGYSLLGRVSYAALAGVFGVVSGNLYAAKALIADLQAASPLHDQLNPVTTAGASLPIVGGIIDLFSGVWSLLSGLVRGTLAVLLGIGQVLLGHAQLPQYDFSSNWPWDQSRIIDNHTIITEYPYWTFLFADPHAHMWDVPFVLCILALAFNFVLGGPATSGRDEGEEGNGSRHEVAASRPLLPGAGIVVWPVMGAIIGAVGPTNPWDLALALGAIALAVLTRSLWLRQGWPRAIGGLAWRMATLVVFAFGLYAPFYTHFQSFYSSIGLTILRHETPIGDFLTHFGFFILLLGSYLTLAVVMDTNLGLWLRARVRAALFTMYYWDRRTELPRYFTLVRHAAERTGAPLRYGELGGPTRLLVLVGVPLVLLFVVIQYAVLALLTALIAAALLLLVDRRQRHDENTRFLHLLIILGLGAAAAAEIVYVKDFYDGDPLNFRTNTVFKIYEEAWIMMGIAAAASLARLLYPFLSQMPRAVARALAPSAHLLPPRTERRLYGNGGLGGARRPGSWAWAWLAVAALLFVGAEIGPLRTTPLRVTARESWAAVANANIGPTLDGSTFIKYAYPSEYAAIGWINQNIQGAPVMLQSRYGNYRDFAARVVMFTGLPTVVDWGFEVAQQRYSGQTAPNGLPYPDEVAPREQDVDTIYSTADPLQALALLHKYNVSFVYVGQFEKQGFIDDCGDPKAIPCVGYPPSGIAKFAVMAATGELQLAYSHLNVQIYCVGRCPAYLHPETH